MAERLAHLVVGAALSLALVVPIGACATTTEPDSLPTASSPRTEDAASQRFPDIVDAELRPRPDGSFDVAVTVSSPYDTPQRYADGWRVLTTDGTLLGDHGLAHDHANEQPFTRLQVGLQIPPGVTVVVVEGRDSRYGYGGGTVTVEVPAAE